MFSTTGAHVDEPQVNSTMPLSSNQPALGAYSVDSPGTPVSAAFPSSSTSSVMSPNVTTNSTSFVGSTPSGRPPRLARGARSAEQATSSSPPLGASASATVPFCPSAETSSAIGPQVEEPQVTIANRRPSSSQAASISSPSTGVVVPESSGSGLLVGASEPGDDEHPTM